MEREPVWSSDFAVGDETLIPIVYTGLRPGEKLSEELITEEEGILPTTHEKIMVVKGTECDLAGLQRKIDELAEAAFRQDAERIRTLFQEIIIPK